MTHDDPLQQAHNRNRATFAHRQVAAIRGRVAKRTYLVDQIRRQRNWIEECGGDIVGYVAHYGADGRPIYRADTTALADLQAELDRLGDE